MQEILIRKFHGYVRDNNPELLLSLEQENRVTNFLHESVSGIDSLLNELMQANQPVLIIEEYYMEELTKRLRPSRFNYLKAILEEEFPAEVGLLHQWGIVTTELVNLVAACRPVFDEFNFSEENENDRWLRYAVTGAVQEYLASSPTPLQRRGE